MKPRALALIGMGLVLPTFLFVSANVLKHEMGVPFLHDALGGIIQMLGSPVLILGGLLGASMLNIWPMVRVTVKREPDSYVGTVTLRPHGWNIAVLAVSAALLAVIFLYLLAENLGHLHG